MKLAEEMIGSSFRSKKQTFICVLFKVIHLPQIYTLWSELKQLRPCHVFKLILIFYIRFQIVSPLSIKFIA